MIMRLTDAANKVCHIPRVLYFWRCHKMSTSMNLSSKSYAITAGRRAVRDAEIRRGYPAEVHSAQICKTHYRMKYEIGTPKVSVIIDGSEGDFNKVSRTAAAIEKISAYPDYELYYALSQEELTDTLSQAKGEYLLLLAAGITPITPAFIEELLMFAQRQDVGMAGMQVLDEKNLILSSDLVIGASADTLALEANRGERYDAPGYMGRNYYAHNISAISGCACMAKKEELSALWKICSGKNTFGKILEICFWLRKKEKQIVLNPYALCRIPKEEYKWELQTADAHRLWTAYQPQITAGDPFYNRNLSYEKYWRKK